MCFSLCSFSVSCCLTLCLTCSPAAISLSCTAHLLAAILLSHHSPGHLQSPPFPPHPPISLPLSSLLILIPYSTLKPFYLSLTRAYVCVCSWVHAKIYTKPNWNRKHWMRECCRPQSEKSEKSICCASKTEPASSRRNERCRLKTYPKITSCHFCFIYSLVKMQQSSFCGSDLA